MKIITFNVNGIRAFSKKIDTDFNDYCKNVLMADIICLQEIKGTSGSLLKFCSLKDYQTFSSFHNQKGRHGVATLVKKNLFCSKVEEISKGRILKTHHGNFVLFNCYLPYFDETSDLDKSHIIKEYDLAYESFDREKTIICGDFNACYNLLDHYQYIKEYRKLINVENWTTDLKYNKNVSLKVPGFGDQIFEEERSKRHNAGPRELPFFFFTVNSLEDYFFEVYQRKWLKKLTNEFIDTFRLFNKDLDAYTCWNTVLNNRVLNLGTRIDYIFCTQDIYCVSSGINSEILGSDHCPVYAEFNIANFQKPGKNLVEKKNNLLEFFNKK